MSDETAKIPPDYAVPGCAFPLVELMPSRQVDQIWLCLGSPLA